MNVLLGLTPRIKLGLMEPGSVHLGVTGPTTRAPVGNGESTTSVAV